MIKTHYAVLVIFTVALSAICVLLDSVDAPVSCTSKYMNTYQCTNANSYYNVTDTRSIE